MSSHTLQQMSVDNIVPSKDNARHIDQKSESFLELKESIKAGGVQIPIHVWPHPKRKRKYEIRAGERRWRACKSLGHKTIPAIVHRGIGYDVAMALTYTENKFREALAPLEEVEEIARCMVHLNSDAKLIAGLLGQTEQWVRLRANIHKNLVQGWRQAFRDPDRPRVFKKWSIGHLTLVARLPANSQKELLAEIKQHYWNWENTSVKDLDRRIGSTLMQLSRAKWSLDDETLLPRAGACSKCARRTGAQPVLWFGATNDQISSKDRCLDLRCWRNKMLLYLQQRAKQASEKHSNLAYIATENLSSDDKEELSKKFGRVLDRYDVQRSTKGAKGAIPALVVHGSGLGNVAYVREKQAARPAGAKRAGKPTPLKERKALLNCKRWAQVLRDLSQIVENSDVGNIVYEDKITAVMALTALHGNRAIEDEYGQNAGLKLRKKEVKNLLGKKDKRSREEALTFLWNSLKPTLVDLLTYNGAITQTPQSYIDDAKWIAKLVQVNISGLFEQVSKQKGFTEPKSWAGLNADGTPKAARKVKKKKSA